MDDLTKVKQRPRNVEAEQVVLGSMLSDVDSIETVQEILTAGDYYEPRNRIIHEAIVRLADRGDPVEPITVISLIEKESNLTKIGGGAYVFSLVDQVVTSYSVDYYAKLVAEVALKRRVIDVGERITQMGYSLELSADQLAEEVEAQILALGATQQNSGYVEFSQITSTLIEELSTFAGSDEFSGIPTGFFDLDELTQGLHPGQMIIVAARPAMGKSTLAMDFCRSAAIRNDLVTLIFSLEMSKVEIALRVLAAEARIPLSKMRAGLLEPRDWESIATHLATMGQKPLYINDTANITMRSIRAEARRVKHRHGLDLLVVDYLQLLTSNRSYENRQQEVSEYSRSLKLLAKELEIPVVAVAQLNRGPEQRADKRPLMADLRESGSLEQDADVVMLLHRPEYYDENDRPGEADIIVAKHRNGQTRTIPVTFLGQYTSFANLMKEMPSNEPTYFS